MNTFNKRKLSVLFTKKMSISLIYNTTLITKPHCILYITQNYFLVKESEMLYIEKIACLFNVS